MDIDITILPDDVVEDTESFSLSLSPVTLGSRIISGRGAATAFIIDGDCKHCNSYCIHYFYFHCMVYSILFSISKYFILSTPV